MIATMPTSAVRRAAPFVPLVLLYLVVGIGALVLELAWLRLFAVALGDTAATGAAVVAAALAGLGVGSYVGGRLADRTRDRVRLFGLLEIAAGLTAAATPIGVHIAAAAVPTGQSVAAFVAALLTIGVPSALIGAALPLLASGSADPGRHVARRLALLYGANSAGGVIGILVAAFFLLETLGTRATLFAAAALIAAAGLLALLLARTRLVGAHELPEAAPPAAPDAPLRRPDTLVLALFALSGFTAIGYEFLWARVLAYTMDTTLNSYAILLATYLAGLALGSLVIGPFAGRNRRPLLALGLLEGLVGLSVIYSLRLVADWNRIGFRLDDLIGHADLLRGNLERGLASGLVVFLPTLFLGATFPFAVRACTRPKDDADAGGPIGRLASLNALGGTAGALVAALAAAPLLGTDRGLVLFAFLNVAAGLAFIAATDLPRGMRVALSLGLFLLFAVGRGLLPAQPLAAALSWRDPGARLVSWREGNQGIVTVHEYPGVRTLSVNGVTSAGSDLVLSTAQRLEGHLPCLLHPDPHTALEIGAGSGETARVLLAHGLERVDAVEIATGIQPLVDSLGAGRSAVFKDPRFHQIVADGRAWLRRSHDRYDIIVNDPTHPALAGGALLFTREEFRACRAHLNPGGIMLSWIPVYGVTPAEFDAMVATFLESFPHATLWFANNSLNRHALLAASAGDEPMRINWTNFASRMTRPEVATDLAELNLGDPYSLLDSFVMDESALARFASGARVNTEDRPWIEFSLPRITQTDAELVANLIDRLAIARQPVVPLLTHLGSTAAESSAVCDTLATFYAATTQLLHGISLDVRGVSSEPEKAYQAALSLNPRDLDARFFLQNRAAEETELAQAVASNPKDLASRLALARLHIRQGKFSEARDELRASLNESRGDASVWYDLGVSSAHLNDPADAEKSYREAMRLDPALPQPHVNLGTLFQRMGRYEDAVNEYKAALALDPAHPEANYDIGVAYAQKGLHKDAIPYFEKALASRPNYPEALYNLGISRATTGNLPGAIEAWKECLARDPGNRAAQANLARAMSMLGPAAPGAPPAPPGR